MIMAVCDSSLTRAFGILDSFHERGLHAHVVGM
jgi:hypothetical protein